ncbi:hypothetical protein BKA57DRAFT_35915 [Linnemannia elongata]|nr:hypothetical protein BKA57DRAFT_35915 [Linnemannia elongata]
MLKFEVHECTLNDSISLPQGAVAVSKTEISHPIPQPFPKRQNPRALCVFVCFWFFVSVCINSVFFLISCFLVSSIFVRSLLSSCPMPAMVDISPTSSRHLSIFSSVHFPVKLAWPISIAELRFLLLLVFWYTFVLIANGCKDAARSYPSTYYSSRPVSSVETSE